MPSHWGEYGGLKHLLANPWNETEDRHDRIDLSCHYQIDTVDYIDFTCGGYPCGSDNSAKRWKTSYYDNLNEWQAFDNERAGRFSRIKNTMPEGHKTEWRGYT